MATPAVISVPVYCHSPAAITISPAPVWHIRWASTAEHQPPIYHLSIDAQNNMYKFSEQLGDFFFFLSLAARSFLVAPHLSHRWYHRKHQAGAGTLAKKIYMYTRIHTPHKIFSGFIYLYYTEKRNGRRVSSKSWWYMYYIEWYGVYRMGYEKEKNYTEEFRYCLVLFYFIVMRYLLSIQMAFVVTHSQKRKNEKRK